MASDPITSWQIEGENVGMCFNPGISTHDYHGHPPKIALHYVTFLLQHGGGVL